MMALPADARLHARSMNSDSSAIEGIPPPQQALTVAHLAGEVATPCTQAARSGRCCLHGCAQYNVRVRVQFERHHAEHRRRRKSSSSRDASLQRGAAAADLAHSHDALGHRQSHAADNHCGGP